MWLEYEGSGVLARIRDLNPEIRNSIVVTNAAGFHDNQEIKIFDSLAETVRGSVHVLSVDAVANTIWLMSPRPAGTAVGDLILTRSS